MKKILLIIPVIICLISNLIVLPASAESYNPADLLYYPLKDFKEHFNYNDSQFYFYAQHYRNDCGRTYSVYIQADNFDIIESDGTYRIDFPSSCDLALVENVGSSDYPWFSDYIDFSFNHLVIDTNFNTCFFYDDSHNVSFPFYPGDSESFEIFYDYKTNIFNAYPNLPNVTVEFSPVLSGEVDRSVVNSNGTTSKLQDLQMTVHNLSLFPIQYRMQINVADPITHRLYNGNYGTSGVDEDDEDRDSKIVQNRIDWLNTRYDSDPVFIYYSNTQVYDGNISGSKDHDFHNMKLYNKASEWHKVSANSDDVVTIPFSMINLNQDINYIVTVDCYKLDLDYVSNRSLNDELISSNDFAVQAYSYFVAYKETFSFKDYSDIVYNPTLSFGDVLPFDASKGYAQQFLYDNNFDAVTNPSTGDLSIGHYDIMKDPDSWLADPDYFHNSNSFLNSTFDFSVSSFSGMFSNVFGFVNMFMNYLPSQIMAIFIFGFSCIVVIAIIKAVR